MFLTNIIIPIGGHQMIFFIINNSFQLFCNALQALMFNGPPIVYEIQYLNSFIDTLHNSMT